MFDFFNILPRQLQSYLDYCTLANSVSDSCLDLKSLSYIYPTTLLPLLMKHPCNELEITPNSDCAKYLKFMINSKENQIDTKSSFFPPIVVPKKESEFQSATQKLYEFHNDGTEYGGINAFKFIMGEC